MHRLTLILIAIISFSFVRQEERGIILTYQRISSEKDSSLKATEALYEFHFKADSILEGTNFNIQYAIDGKDGSIDLHGDEPLKLKTTPGKHKLQFYLDDGHFEITIEGLEINAQYEDVYEIYFENSEFPVIVDKPVIYLYPDKKQEINLSADIQGENVFEYPEFNNLRHDLLSWKVNADPNGDIYYKNKTYNYLFWEAEQKIHLDESDLKEGYIVESNELTSFLEEKLKHMGFTTKEMADFITYWVPRMRKYKMTYIHFVTGNECDQFAKYIIEPNPDHMNRLYMLWTHVGEFQQLKEQSLPVFQRDGFSVFEWGGFELNLN